MNNADLQMLVKDSQTTRLNLMFGEKTQAYSGSIDRLANFSDICNIIDILRSYMTGDRTLGQYQSDMCFVLMMKHFVRLMKVIGSFSGLDNTTIAPDIAQEIFGDLQNYLDLLKANMVEEEFII